jgi:hypothetical protein
MPVTVDVVLNCQLPTALTFGDDGFDVGPAVGLEAEPVGIPPPHPESRRRVENHKMHAQCFMRFPPQVDFWRSWTDAALNRSPPPRQKGLFPGDRDNSLKAYDDFFTTWKTADPDIPILRQAKAEYKKLTETASATASASSKKQ